MIVEYPENFKKLVNDCSEKGLYIGTGNPIAKILIIGKECAHNFNNKELSRDIFLEAEKCEVSFNCLKWQNVLASNVDINDIQNWDRDWSKYDVRHPFKGQRRILDNQVNDGTSDTWMNYQILVEQIVSPNRRNDEIDFHKYCFITEINQISSPTSNLLDKFVKEEVREVVRRREVELFGTHKEFFRQFPVVIIAGLSYPNQFRWNFCNLFDVEFKEKKGEKSRQHYWIHKNTSGDRILIHTRQMSMDVSDKLIQDIANECRVYYPK